LHFRGSESVLAWLYLYWATVESWVYLTINLEVRPPPPNLEVNPNPVLGF
jgi:hypothetical protein